MQMLVQLTANAARFILGGVTYVTGHGDLMLCGGRNFQVASECSGINSIIAISLTTFGFLCFTGRTVKQWMLLLLAPLLAWVGNVLRVCTVVLCSGNQLVHDVSGYVIFLLVLFAWLRIFERRSP